MSHWQTGKIQLKCSINILKKALINIMPEWEKCINSNEDAILEANFHGKPVQKRFNIVVAEADNITHGLYGDLGFARNEDGTWEVGGDYSVDRLKEQLTGEVARMKAFAIAKMRGYDIIKNEENEGTITTDIRVDSEKAKELLF